MSHVKITQGVDYLIQVEIDGQPIKDLTRVQMDFPADAMPEVHLGIVLTKPFEFEGDTNVQMHLHIPKGTRMMDITTQADGPGRKRLMVVPTAEEK